MEPLMSKLARPSSRDLIVRHRLSPLLDKVPGQKLTLVTAGPGYGKTALVSQAMNGNDRTDHRKDHREDHRDTVWLRLGGADRDPASFFNCLTQGIRQVYPDFTGNGDPAAFLAGLEQTVEQDLVLVLDDVHLVSGVPVITDFLQAFLDRFCPFFHLVLISRNMPELRFSKLMADRSLSWFTETDLVFTPPEIGLMFETCFDMVLTEDDMTALFDKTGGWVSGLVLFFQSLQGQVALGKAISDLPGRIAGFKGGHRYVYAYMDENILQCQEPEIRDFLLKTALLPELHVNFCDRFLGLENSRAILCDLENRHSFTFSSDEDRNRFFYHPLFRQFLQAKLERTMPARDIAGLYNEAALLYEQRDDGQKALRYHILAGNIEDASRLLNHLARPIIKQGRPQMVKSLLTAIPKHYMDDEPWFQYLATGYLRLCNRLEMAVQSYERVLRSFRRQKDEEGECICRMELAEYYMVTGDLKQSEVEYKKILAKNKLTAYLTIIVMGYLIRVLTLSGKTGEADKYARQAIGLLPEVRDDLSLKMGQGWISMSQGYRYLLTGDYHRAMELGEQSLSLFRSVGQHRFMFSGYYLISCSCFYLGQFTKGKAAAEEGVQIESEKGVFDEFSEFLRLLHARNSLEIAATGPEDVSRSLSQCKKGLKIFQSHAFPGGVAQAFLVLHRAYLKAGKVQKAEMSLRNGLKALSRHDMPLIENELKVALSHLLFFLQGRDRNQEAMVLLKEAEQALLYSGWHMCWISRIFARYYWEHGHRETCFKYIVYSLKISEEEGFDNWIVAEKDWIVPLLAELVAVDAMSDYITGICVKIGPQAETALKSLKQVNRKAVRRAAGRILEHMPDQPPPGITAYFFGSFRLFIGNEQIPEKRWKSKKARTLFKYLLCKRGKGFLDKEILMELLWPEEDPRLSAQRFHVALAALRKTLEPRLPKGVRSSYIQRSGSAYRIDIGEAGEVDLDLFLGEIREADAAESEDAAMGHYKKAESIYQGDFLEEDPYEDWCREERERYQQAYLLTLRKIIAFHEARKEYDSCIRFATRYLRCDRYAETVIRSLMTYYDLTGNKPMVRQSYERFKGRVQRELNCGLSDETEILYAELAGA